MMRALLLLVFAFAMGCSVFGATSCEQQCRIYADELANPAQFETCQKYVHLQPRPKCFQACRHGMDPVLIREVCIAACYEPFRTCVGSKQGDGSYQLKVQDAIREEPAVKSLIESSCSPYNDELPFPLLRDLCREGQEGNTGHMA